MISSLWCPVTAGAVPGEGLAWMSGKAWWSTGQAPQGMGTAARAPGVLGQCPGMLRVAVSGCLCWADPFQLRAFCDSLGRASPGITKAERSWFLPVPGLGSPSSELPGGSLGSAPSPSLLSTALAASGSQFGTASVCVLLLPSIVQLMLKSILVLILGHD